MGAPHSTPRTGLLHLYQGVFLAVSLWGQSGRAHFLPEIAGASCRTRSGWDHSGWPAGLAYTSHRSSRCLDLLLKMQEFFVTFDPGSVCIDVLGLFVLLFWEPTRVCYEFWVSLTFFWKSAIFCGKWPWSWKWKSLLCNHFHYLCKLHVSEIPWLLNNRFCLSV